MSPLPLTSVARRILAPWLVAARAWRLVITTTALILGTAGWGPTVHAATEETIGLEYKVKAGYLFNFTKFVEWPPTALAPGEPIRVGLVAPDAVCGVISELLQGKDSGGHPIHVEQLTPESKTSTLHLLFVHRETSLDSLDLKRLTGGKPVLVVGESPGFAQNGGAIGFVLRNGSLRFQVNLAASEQANLRLSSRLASMGEVVRVRQ